jgi:hypothetical protein
LVWLALAVDTGCAKVLRAIGGCELVGKSKLITPHNNLSFWAAAGVSDV